AKCGKLVAVTWKAGEYLPLGSVLVLVEVFDLSNLSKLLCCCLARVFYCLHLTWNLASSNTLASTSLPPSSPEKWTTVKRKFKQTPHPFPSHNRPHRPSRSPPSAPTNGRRSAGRAPGRIPALRLSKRPLMLPLLRCLYAPRVPSPLVHMSRDDVSDLFASVSCPSSPPLISSSPDILSNSLPESGLSQDLPVLQPSTAMPSSSSSVEPTAVFSLSEAAPISPLLITPTLLPLSTLACTPSSSIVPSPALSLLLAFIEPPPLTGQLKRSSGPLLC
ncbi:hypothetical protein AMTR_s00020p00246500, partial [Amborella trichopoda]